ncbi:MAG: hypothetical protein DRZ76_01845 [Candidatus Nealsonbacteria bacterium]|nr:MAG: hypothetical protein DRZ76_01845 [Candidatus Nealsonbacteria bacterium]
MKHNKKSKSNKNIIKSYRKRFGRVEYRLIKEKEHLLEQYWSHLNEVKLLLDSLRKTYPNQYHKLKERYKLLNETRLSLSKYYLKNHNLSASLFSLSEEMLT